MLGRKPKYPCPHCGRKFTDIPKHEKVCTKNVSNKEGHSKAKFEGQYYIWGNGKKTHVKFIQRAVQQSHPLPVGFYEAAKNSNDRGIQKLLQVAEIRKIPENAEKLDTRS